MRHIRRHSHHFRTPTVILTVFLSFLANGLFAQNNSEVQWTAEEKPIYEQIRGLRALPDDVRAETTKALALRIRKLPTTENKLRLANALASRSTEGDFGQETLQEVATTLAESLREQPIADKSGEPAAPYEELAELIRYEHVKVSLKAKPLDESLTHLKKLDDQRQAANFTLTDLQGNTWTLSKLRGSVVLVNFWATWCPPCRKEMPDLNTLYGRFKKNGLVILAISDEEAQKVSAFVQERNISYPILLDPGSDVHKVFGVEGIPKSFVYDRSGRLVAQAEDMRTGNQFLKMLSEAGLE